ncbi:hypothetical protein D9M70_547160 [compost metagenome]
MIPEVVGWHAIVVAEAVGETAVNEVPLRPPDVGIGAVEELGISVELEIAVPAMEVSADRYAILLDAEVPVVHAVGRVLTVQRIAPVQVGVEGKEVLPAQQFVPPAHDGFVGAAG